MNMCPEAQKFLPPEIISEILYRVPVKPLIKLQLVCKNWQSIIYSLHFAETYGDASGLVTHFSIFLPDTSEEQNDKQQTTCYLEYIGGCYGLALVMYANNKCCIWNPTIHKLLELPDPHQDQYNSAMAISYIPSSRSFKLLSVYKDENSALAFEVFTLGHSQSWRRLTFTPPDIIPQSTVDKSFDWIISTGEEVHCCFRYLGEKAELIHSVVISVNMGTESFCITPIPKDEFGFDGSEQLDWNGHLGYVVIKDENLHVMVLEKHCKKPRWSETKKIIPLPFIRKEKYSSDSLMPLMLAKDGDIWFCLKEKKMFTYNIDTGLVTDKSNITASARAGRSFIPYKPSTISFQGMKPDDKLESMRPLF